MESPSLQPPVGNAPDRDPAPPPGSHPLRIQRHEDYAKARASGLPPHLAASSGGYDPKLRGTLSKLERNGKIRDRVRYLSGETEETIREQRRRVQERLETFLGVNLENYGSINRKTGKFVVDLRELDKADPELRQALLGCIQEVSFDSKGRQGIKLHSPLDAASQLRKLHGLDAPKKVAPTNPAGDGPAILEVRWKSDEEV